MIFTVIHIDTGYLNRPNWLLRLSQGCFPDFPAGFPAHNVYDRLAISAPATRRCVRDHNVYDRPAISAPATARAGRNIFLWMYYDTQHWQQNRGYAYESLSKVYCDRVYFLCAERFETGSGFRPPAAPPPPVHMSVECPPPGINHTLFVARVRLQQVELFQ